MEKRRIKLEINGVICGLITEESEEYMQSLAKEIAGMTSDMLQASPYITREMAALTTALSYCDDVKKSKDIIKELEKRNEQLEKRAHELEERALLLEKENSQLWEETDKLMSAEKPAQKPEDKEVDTKAEKKINEKAEKVEKTESAEVPTVKAAKKENIKAKKNPFKLGEDFEQQGFVSFFEKEK